MSVNEGAKVSLSGATWLRASDDPTEDGVEVAMLAEGHVALRDSRQPDGPVLIFTPGEWTAFTAGARDGEFDRPK
ncbi:DUF397 domain-containing protein [Nocardia sp. NPDC052566]|uniref:DUF397 domain-containing protein n=1 Tax=Nocardia sp. NPDC052566 TaxID=3364330 RepID=UPI0037C77C38